MQRHLQQARDTDSSTSLRIRYKPSIPFSTCISSNHLEALSRISTKCDHHEDFYLMIISAIATCIFYLYMVHFKYFQRYIVFSACLITSSLSISIFFSNNILSEFPFAFLTLIALWSIDSLIIHDTSNKGHLFLVGFLSSLPFLCRTIGGLLPLLFLLLLWRKRPVAWMTFGAAIIVVPWMLWCTFGNNSNNDNIMGFYTSYSSWWLHSTDINALWKIIFYNLIFILMSVPQLSGIYDVFKYIFSTYYYIYLIPFGIMAFYHNFYINHVKLK